MNSETKKESQIKNWHREFVLRLDLNPYQRGFYEWLERVGEVFTPQDLWLDHSYDLRNCSAPRSCFHNSQKLQKKDKQHLTYYEGFYITEFLPMPVEHGFVKHSSGRIIDPTVQNSFLLKEVKEWVGVPVENPSCYNTDRGNIIYQLYRQEIEGK